MLQEATLEAMFPTARLKANHCPEHRNGKFIVLGNLPFIELNSERGEILLPDNPTIWEKAKGDVPIIVQCVEVNCGRVTLFFPGEYKWEEETPTGWRNEVGFFWLTGDPKRCNLNNVVKVKVISVATTPLTVSLAYNHESNQIFAVQRQWWDDMIRAYIAGQEGDFKFSFNMFLNASLENLPFAASRCNYETKVLREATKKAVRSLKASKTFVKSKTLAEIRKDLQAALREAK